MPVLKRLFSTCEELLNRRVIKKYNNDPISLGLLDNEVKWYKRFNQVPGATRHTPKMFDYSRDTLVLEYVGNPISKGTILVNFKNQLRQIASLLKYHHCKHCDITPGNLLVLNTNTFIIDFEWAVEMDRDTYWKWKHVDKSVLDNIGEDYRARNWPDDKYSLAKIYSEFSGNIKDKLFYDPKSG